MRKFLIAASSLMLTTVFFANISFCQDYAYHNPFTKTTMASFMTSDNAVEKELATASVDANAKLQKRFNQRFKNPGHVDWYTVKNAYLAVFDNEGRKTRALFTKNGYNIYAIAYGAEKDLPKNYRRALKSLYVDYDILNAVEIQSASVSHTTWLATLKDDNNIVITRIIDGNVDEFARYNTKPKEVKKQRKGRIIIPKTMSKS